MIELNLDILIAIVLFDGHCQEKVSIMQWIIVRSNNLGAWFGYMCFLEMHEKSYFKGIYPSRCFWNSQLEPFSLLPFQSR